MTALPALLQRLHTFARDRVAEGHGLDGLRSVGLAERALLDAYHLGYLPEDIDELLTDADRAALGGVRLANRLFIPAFDQQGVVVDGVLIDPTDGSSAGIVTPSQGLLAPRLTTAFDAVPVVESLDELAAAVAADPDRLPLWLRDAADRERFEATECFILTEDELELIEHDQRRTQASYRAGPITYLAEVPFDAGSVLEIAIRETGTTTTLARDRFDWAVASQRQRFAALAARSVSITPEQIDGHLVQLLDLVRELAVPQLDDAPAPSPTVTVSGDERAAALRCLNDPALLDHLLAKLTTLGWVGDAPAKTLTLLAALSRKLPEPLWAALELTDAAPDVIGLLAAITPPEDVWHVSRLTESALFYQDANALRHKLLLIDDPAMLRPDIHTALRVLHHRGALSLSHAQRDPVIDHVQTHFLEVRGPVAVVTLASTKPTALQACCHAVALDTSSEQTAAVLAAQCARAQHPMAASGHGEIRARLHDLQRLLPTRPVAIPDANALTGVVHPTEQARLFQAIQAHALLYQHQRPVVDGVVLASPRDRQVVVECWRALAARRAPGLSARATTLLARLRQHGSDHCTMADLTGWFPGWTRYAFRSALAELRDLDYLTVSGGRGRGGQRYTLTALATATADQPTSQPSPTIGEIGENWRTGFANLSPVPRAS